MAAVASPQRAQAVPTEEEEDFSQREWELDPNPVAQFTLGYVNPLFRLGAKRALLQKDLGRVEASERVEEVYKRFVAAREKEKVLPAKERSLWRALRDRFGAGGPFLLGPWSIVDAYFTPVASRLRTYAVDLAHHGDEGFAAAYAALLLQQPEFLDWERLALAEK